MPPFVVLEDGLGGRRASADAEVVLRGMAGEGWSIARDWVLAGPGRRIVCTGAIVDAGAARSALIAALSGAALVVTATADRAVIDELVDDLRRLGPVQHVADGGELPARLDGDRLALLALLAEGRTLGSAAAQLGLSRRTADRRLAEARAALGVERTVEAIARALQQQFGAVSR